MKIDHNAKHPHWTAHREFQSAEEELRAVRGLPSSRDYEAEAEAARRRQAMHRARAIERGDLDKAVEIEGAALLAEHYAQYAREAAEFEARWLLFNPYDCGPYSRA